MSREAMERAIATIVEMRNELAYESRAFAGSIQTLALLRAALSAPAQQQAGTVQACSFPERDETKPAEQQGLYRKFIVRRVDGSDAPGGKHHGCEYFVIDMTNDQYAPVALRPYAVACRATHPALSADLQARFGDAPEQEPVDAEIDSQLKALRSEEAKKTNPRKNRSSPDRPRVYGNSAPQPAPGLILDSRGVLVRQSDDDETTPDDSPFCECGNEPYEEEAASGVCSACGAALGEPTDPYAQCLHDRSVARSRGVPKEQLPDCRAAQVQSGNSGRK